MHVAGRLLIFCLAAAGLLAQSGSSVPVFSFALGGFGNYAIGLAVDAVGSSYIVGSRYTASEPFPITGGAAQTRPTAIFIAKVDGRGQRFEWATYLGGSRNRNTYWRGALDSPAGIAVDGQGNAIVIGYTAATDFPTENAVVSMPQPTGSEGFLTKISADGTRFVYSTYLAGAAPRAVAADAAGNAYVALEVGRRVLPFERRDLSAPGSPGNVVIAKFGPSGQVLAATRFGSDGTTVTAIAVDPTGAIVIGGTSREPGLPLVRPAVTACWPSGLGFCVNPYVAKLDPTGSQVLFATLLGGVTGESRLTAVAALSDGSVTVAGTTRAVDYPLRQPLQGAKGGGLDYVLTRLGPTGTLEASTYLGGDADEYALGPLPTVFVDRFGRATLAGASAARDGIAPDLVHADVPLWRSDDAGASWRPSARGLRTSAWTFAVSERDRTWYVGAADGVYRSEDGAATWTRVMADRETFQLAVDPARPGTVYAGTRAGTYRTTDRGDRWVQVDDESVLGGPYHVSAHPALVVDGEGTVFLGAEGIRRSQDGGATWEDISNGLERGPTGRYGVVSSLVFDPHRAGTIYALHNSHPYRTRDGGATWTRLEPLRVEDAPYPIRDLYGVSLPAGRPGRIYASDWSRLLRSDDDGRSWTSLADRLLFRPRVLIHPARPDTLYAFDGWAGDPLLVSDDAGARWRPATVPRPGQRAFAVDPSQPDALFAPAAMRTLPLIVAVDRDLRRIARATFVDSALPSTIAMDLTGAIYLTRVEHSRTVLVKLNAP